VSQYSLGLFDLNRRLLMVTVRLLVKPASTQMLKTSVAESLLPSSRSMFLICSIYHCLALQTVVCHCLSVYLSNISLLVTVGAYVVYCYKSVAV